MTINATTGPNISFGITVTSSGATQEYNEERGPSLMDLGEGLMDPRPQFTFKPGSRPGAPVYGWPGLFGGPVLDAIPKTADSSGICATQSCTATGGGTLTLQTSANSSAISVISFTPSTMATPVTVLAIDGPMTGAAFGSAGTINLWNPQTAISRCLTLVSTGNESGVVFTIKGYDLYGFAMSYTSSGPSNGTATTLKAFKYVQSITYNTAGNSPNFHVGTADVFGFPLRVDHPSYITAWWGPSSGATQIITSTAGFHTFASTAAAVSSGGDVRGTLASSNGSNSSAAAPFKLTMNISPSVSNLQTVTASDFSGLVGVPQA